MDRLGNYDVLAKIGEGGMGSVFRAQDRRSGRAVALKLMHPDLQGDPQQRLRFLREAEIGRAVAHSNVVAVYDIDEVHLRNGQRTLVVAFELVFGLDFYSRLSRSDLSERFIVSVGRQVAGALAAIHDAGVVHRDLKSSNVLVTSAGVAKILDFGLAKMGSALEVVGPACGPETGATAGAPDGSAVVDLAALRTATGSVVGTVGYAAPEQLRGEPARSASDLYALGVMLYQGLSGRLPFVGANVAEVLAAAGRQAPSLFELRPGVDPRLVAIVDQLLDPDPKRRGADAASIKALLEAIERSPLAAAVSGAEDVPDPRGWRSWWRDRR